MAAGLAERPLAVKDAQQVLEVDGLQGRVRAIVSVTGVVDEVGDVIEPGAYAKTLQKRVPKCCDGHDWAKPIGVAVECEEWYPGDERLPAQTKDGKPWPREAGALVADIQFNMGTERGEQAFKDVQFYSQAGVAEWSIGYQVPPGKATRDAKGIRHIKEVDLYTVDPVLFGAAPLSMTLDVKSAASVLQRLQHGEPVEEIERKGGSPDDAPYGLDRGLEGKYDTSPTGTPGGHQNWIDQTGGLPPFMRAIVHALKRNGKSESAAVRIAWGTLRRWARGGGNVSEKTRTKSQETLAQLEKMRAEAHVKKSLPYDPMLEVGPDAGHVQVQGKTAATAMRSLWDDDEEIERERVTGKAITDQGEDTLSFKAFPYLPGTLEERLEEVRVAVNARYRPSADGLDRPDPSPSPVYAWVQATTPDSVIVDITNERTGERRTVQVDYSVDQDGVHLGDEREVALVVVPAGSDSGDGDGDIEGSDGDTDAWLDALSDWMPDLDGEVKSIAGVVQQAMRLAPHGKAGRVLSGNNAGLLRQAVEHLIAVLKAAGIDVNPNQAPAQADAATADTTAQVATEPVGAVAGKSLGGGEILTQEDLPDLSEVLAAIDATVTA
jgi:hypothetical protein